MTPALRQLRDGIKVHISQDPTIVTPMRRALVSDGFGGYSRTGSLAAEPLARVRIQHEASSVQRDQAVPSGLGTSLSLYVLTDYRAPLLEGDEFAYDGYTWRVGVVNKFARHGGVYKTESPLVRGSAIPVTIPGSFTAVAISDTEIDLTWTDTGAVNTYSIERKTGTAAFAVIATPAAGAVIYHDTGRTPSTAYVYRIRAYSGTTPSSYSDEETATTEATP